MANPVYYDRVKEISTTAGTLPFVLSGAVVGYQTFAVVGNGNNCHYCATDNYGNWEVGNGTYTSSTTSLSRDTIIASSTGSRISFPNGPKQVFLTVPSTVITASGIIGLSGYTGTSGYSGSGVSGYSGSGVSGYSGTSGTSGYIGLTGASGYSGYSGTSGFPGGSVIRQYITTGSQASVLFTGIPQYYTDIKAVIIGRDAASSSQLTIYLKVNGDADPNSYTNSNYIVGTGTLVTGGVEAPDAIRGAAVGSIPGNDGNADAYGMIDLLFPSYSGSTFFKGVLTSNGEYFGATPFMPLITRTFTWKSTDPVTSLEFFAGGTNFVDGTVITLYGIGGIGVSGYSGYSGGITTGKAIAMAMIFGG